MNTGSKDNGKTEEVIEERRDAIAELIAQNKRTLELLEMQQKENCTLIKGL